MHPTNGHSVTPVREGQPSVYDTSHGPDGNRVNGVNQRPVGELFEDLTNDTRTLLSLELELLRAEMTQKARQAGKDVGFIAAGGFVIYAGFIAIVAAVAFGLGNFIPTWLAFLIVGVVVALIGYVVMRKGLDDLKSRSMAPEKTIASLKHDKEWLQRARSQ